MMKRFIIDVSILLLIFSMIPCLSAQRCLSTCRIPDCSCPRVTYPMPTRDIPQMVYFGFDDAVNIVMSSLYERIFTKTRKNPNGCRMKMALYVSHQYTDYRKVKQFYDQGNEIGVHSVTHSAIDNDEILHQEAKQQKENLVRAGIPAKDIIGWRSPFLKTAGKNQPMVLKGLGYEYDISLTYTRPNMAVDKPWPFTMDHGWPYPCGVEPCPYGAHAENFWAVPVVSLMDHKNKYPCPYVDGCAVPALTEQQAYDFLWKNFMSYYNTSRSPFGLNMHAAWFYRRHNLKAMMRFLDELMNFDDVYVVTVKQMLDWMKHPTPLSEIDTLQSWQCAASRNGLRRTQRVTTPKPRQRGFNFFDLFKGPSPLPRRKPKRIPTRTNPLIPQRILKPWFNRAQTTNPPLPTTTKRTTTKQTTVPTTTSTTTTTTTTTTTPTTTPTTTRSTTTPTPTTTTTTTPSPSTTIFTTQPTTTRTTTRATTTTSTTQPTTTTSTTTPKPTTQSTTTTKLPDTTSTASTTPTTTKLTPTTTGRSETSPQPMTTKASSSTTIPTTSPKYLKTTSTTTKRPSTTTVKVTTSVTTPTTTTTTPPPSTTITTTPTTTTAFRRTSSTLRTINTNNESLVKPKATEPVQPIQAGLGVKSQFDAALLNELSFLGDIKSLRDILYDMQAPKTTTNHHNHDLGHSHGHSHGHSRHHSRETQAEVSHNVQPTLGPSTVSVQQQFTHCVQGVNCHLPACFCQGSDIPNGLRLQDIPQLVFITIDGSVNARIYRRYQQIFSGRQNPNKCRTRGTIFATDSGTSPSLVRKVINLGAEVAMQGLHEHHYDTVEHMEQEIIEQKLSLKKSDVSHTKGWKTPELKAMGNAQYTLLKKYGFLYDATLSMTLPRNGDSNPWPFTFDFGFQGDCVIPECPTQRFSGLWEVPSLPVKDYKNMYECAYVDGCMFNPPTVNDTETFLWNNFMINYKSNKAPFGIHLRHLWFSHHAYKHNILGLKNFLNRLSSLKDVYLVSTSDVIEWVQNPTPLKSITKKVPWNCS